MKTIKESIVKESDDPLQKQRVDRLIDFLKHITTLSSGGLVVIGTFLERLSNTNSEILLILSAALFLASIISSIMAISFFVIDTFTFKASVTLHEAQKIEEEREKFERKRSNAVLTFGLLALLAFVIAASLFSYAAIIQVILLQPGKYAA